MPVAIDHLIHSKRKTIALIVRADGTLEVRAPLRMSQTQIQQFVENHADWIRKKKKQVKTNAPPPKRFLEGEKFLFLGKEYPLIVTLRQRRALIFEDGVFRLARSAQPQAEQAFTDWYKAQAVSILRERVQILAKLFGFEYRKIRISSARTRWGSCSSKGTLSFTWRLVMAPLQVLDYVIVHELVHLKHLNHSPRFWHQVSEIIPDYKNYVRWLKKNGRNLILS